MQTFMRRLAVVPLLALMFTSGLVVQTQRGAHAVVPAAAVVAPTVVRQVVLPAAAWACKVECRGAITAGAGAAAQAVAGLACFFIMESCSIPWGQSPDKKPNDDQAAGPLPSTRQCEVANQYTCTSGTNIGGTPRNLVAFAYYSATPDPPGAGTVRWRSASGETCTSQEYLSTNYSSKQFGSCLGGAGLEAVEAVSTFVGTSAAWYADGYGPVPPDPERPGQPYKECARQGSGGLEVIRVAGEAISYRESTPERSSMLPPCPTGYPIPLGGGVAGGNPWAPGEVPNAPGETRPGPVPNPVTPPIGLPDPGVVPDQPAPGTTPKRNPAPEPGGVPAGRPLPVVDPATGQPKTNPDGSPVVEPVQPVVNPETGAQEGNCTWGPYAVAAEDCEGAPAPAPVAEPQPSASPGTGVSVPGDDPTAPGATGGCLSSSTTLNPLTWVYAPVKCAAIWTDANLLRPTLAWLGANVLDPLLRNVLQPVIGAIGSAASAVVGAVGSVASSILGGLGSVMSSLFVPSVSLDLRTTALRDRWGATAPAQYLAAFGTVGGSVAAIGNNAAGCAGPRLAVAMGQYDVDMRPLNACPGTVLGRIAPAIRVLLLVGLYLGAVVVVARVLAASLGLTLPSFGNGERT